MEVEVTEINDKNENIKFGLEIIKNEYDSALKRFYEWDSKLNMLFVFVASEVVALSAIYSNMNLKYGAILISIFIIMSVLAISVGLFSKKIEIIDEDHFKHPKVYEKDIFEFIGSYISAYSNCISQLNKKILVKYICFTIAICSLIISLILLIIFMLIGS